MDQMVDPKNAASTEVFRYANAFEALGGNLKDVSPQLKEFVDRMRELEALQPEKGNTFGVENLRRVFGYFDELREEAGATFEMFEKAQIELPKINTIEWAKAAEAAGDTADSMKEEGKAAEDAGKKSEEAGKKSKASSEEAAKAAEESAERQKKAYRSIEELKKKAESKYKGKNKIEYDWEVNDYSFTIDEDLPKIERYKKALKELQALRDEALDDAKYWDEHAVDSYNMGDDEHYELRNENMEDRLREYQEYADKVEYIQNKLNDAIQNFEPGDAWGSEEIKALIELIRNLVESV